MQKHKNLLLLIVVCTILVLSACGRDRIDDYAPNGDYAEGATIEVLSILIPETLLNILETFSTSQFHFHIAEETLNQELYELNREFELEISTFSWRDIVDLLPRMEVLMMAGEMYDIFYLMPQQNLWRYSQNGFLADIYTLIDNCSHTNREDFFINALNAFTINDGLYAFPLGFNFEYIAISAEMPQEFVDRFNGMDAITPIELMHMYIDLRSRYPNEFDSLFVARNSFASFNPDFVLERALSDFVNVNEQVSNINSNRFIEFLNSLKHVHDLHGFSVSAQLDFMIRTSGLCTVGERQRGSVRYMFNSDNVFLNSIFAYFEPSRQSFLYHIPLVNNYGELYLSGFNRPHAFSIAATGNAALAWDFLRHLIVPMAVTTNYRQPRGWNTLTIPIKRSYFESNFLSTIYRSFRADAVSLQFTGMGEGDPGREERIQRALDIHTAFSEMPVATIPLVPISIIEEDLSLFMDGVITAEDAALRMHNRVSLWLIE